MRNQLLVQVYILIAVLNPIFLGYRYPALGWGIIFLGIGNAVLFGGIVLSQHKVLQQYSSPQGRAVFTPGVFLLLSGAVFLIGLKALRFAGIDQGISSLIALAVSLLFYVTIAITCTLYETKPAWEIKSFRGIVAGLLLVIASIAAISMRPLVGVISKGADSLIDQVQQTKLLRTGSPERGAEDDTIAAFVLGEPLPGTLAVEQTDTGTINPTIGETLPLQDIPNNEKKRLFEEEINKGDDMVTFGAFLPVLVEKFALTAPESAAATFSRVPATSPLYEAFRIARRHGMIGTSIAPEATLTCGTMMVMVGLAQNRDVPGQNDIIGAYRDEASKRGYTAYGCSEPNLEVTYRRLP